MHERAQRHPDIASHNPATDPGLKPAPIPRMVPGQDSYLTDGILFSSVTARLTENTLQVSARFNIDLLPGGAAANTQIVPRSQNLLVSMVMIVNGELFRPIHAAVPAVGNKVQIDFSLPAEPGTIVEIFERLSPESFNGDHPCHRATEIEGKYALLILGCRLLAADQQ